jgi:metal-dependent HD superfamily phosphatase/phosphodiesterase
MDMRTHTADEPYEPPPAHRFRVEAAMLEMIERLQQEGLSRQEIALILADAADEYVIILANMTAETASDQQSCQQHQ